MSAAGIPSVAQLWETGDGPQWEHAPCARHVTSRVTTMSLVESCRPVDPAIRGSLWVTQWPSAQIELPG